MQIDVLDVFKRWKKRGQAAGSAAVFIAVIAALLVAFIIMVNPQQRAELLGEPGTASTSSGIIPAGSLVKSLLKVTPGKIDYFSQSDIEHPLPVATIQTKTEAKILAEKNTAYAEQALFSEKEDSLSFSIPNLALTGNVIVGFQLKSLEGTLIVSVNGEEILRAGPDEKIKPITLPPNLLKEENILTVAVSSPGAAFWRTNKVELERLQVVADITSLEAQSSRNVFLLSEVEKRNLERFTLKLRPQCAYGKVGKLSISINGKEVYNGLPDCELGLLSLELSPDGVHQGENVIIFSTESEMYVLNNINLISQLRSLEFPTYYFELSEEDYQKVVKGNLKARLALGFVDVVAVKNADIFFNGHRIPFDTKDVVFNVNVNDYVVSGSNSIKVSPRKTLEVRELRLDLVK